VCVRVCVFDAQVALCLPGLLPGSPTRRVYVRPPPPYTPSPHPPPSPSSDSRTTPAGRTSGVTCARTGCTSTGGVDAVPGHVGAFEEGVVGRWVHSRPRGCTCRLPAPPPPPPSNAHKHARTGVPSCLRAPLHAPSPCPPPSSPSSPPSASSPAPFVPAAPLDSPHRPPSLPHRLYHSPPLLPLPSFTQPPPPPPPPITPSPSYWVISFACAACVAARGGRCTFGNLKTRTWWTPSRRSKAARLSPSQRTL
jgi:hypothetical protein